MQMDSLIDKYHGAFICYHAWKRTRTFILWCLNSMGHRTLTVIMPLMDICFVIVHQGWSITITNSLTFGDCDNQFAVLIK